MIKINNFNSIGYLLIDLSEEQLKPIQQEINKVKSNFLTSIPHNDKLAGNLEKEYRLFECKDYTNNLLMPYLLEYEKYFNYFKDINIVDKDLTLNLESVWVNFMQKHEFNPLHIHAGIFSFVIWIDVPYDIKDEMNRIESKYSNANIPGHFQLVAINSMGELIKENIPADKTFNGKLCIFPSKMNHCVYPFYTSDEYRISVSGNFHLKTT
jgi:hypothetical protein